MGVRYYYYISDAKVDMLLPQIPLAQKHEIATELIVSIPLVVQAKIGSKRMALEDRVSRAKVVESYLSKKARLSGNEDGAWFSGTLIGNAVVFSGIEEAAFFWGTLSGQRILLAGSSHHLIGGEKSEKVSLPISYLPRLMHTFLKIAEGEEDAAKLADPNTDIASETRIGDDGSERMWSRVFGLMSRVPFPAPDEKLDFVARRLMSVQEGGDSVILATPLFVAVKD